MRLCKKLYNKDFVNNTLKKAQTLSKYCCTIAIYKEHFIYTEIPNRKKNYSVIIMNDVPVNCYQAAKLFLN